MQRRYDTSESQRMVNTILTGQEWDSLDIQLTCIDRGLGMFGRRDIRIEAAKRTIIITVYVSSQLDAIYVLGYHLERKGEPTDNQRMRIVEYIAEIQALEKNRS
ncbi:MAG TPA: hypothetical protein VK914_09860 [bacterium]|jgi:hypothetical protein|nr:hypothetical protein [bacterium]